MSVSTMKKLTVLAYAADADAIVRKLMNLRCVELQNLSAEGLLPIDTHENEAQRQEAEQRLHEIKKALPLLAKYTRRKRGIGRKVHRVDRTAFVVDGRAERAWQAVEKTVATAERIENLTTESTRLTNLSESLEPWLPYDAPLNADSSKHTVTVLGSLSAEIDPFEVREKLEAAGAYVEEVSSDEQGRYLAVVCMRDSEEEISRLLTSHSFLKTSFPTVSTTARAAQEQIEEERQALELQLIKEEETLRELSEQLDEVEILYDVEATTVTVCMQKRKLASTHSCVVLSGWIPTAMESAVAEVLSKFECACETEPPDENEEPPVLLRNNRFATNFEWVIGMYSYPRYATFDPTFIMSIFYLVIFGLMFADVGYGLVLTACCFGGIKLLNPKPSMRRMMTMFGFCGISSAVMGVLFGGWFGDLPTAIMSNMLGLPIDTAVGHFFSSGLWLNPLDDPMTFLILSLGVGAVHLIAGMAVKFAVLCKNGQAGEAICTILPYWILFAGFGLFLVDQTVAVWVTVAGAVLILLLNGYGQKSILSRITKGLGGLYGLISYASDLLSYSRILALGMVAGVVAKVINMITSLGATGPIGFAVMLVILILGHVLNIGINVLGTFVHAARLQYIEFFGKFYEDGGEPFDPALPTEEYSEDITTFPNENT